MGVVKRGGVKSSMVCDLTGGWGVWVLPLCGVAVLQRNTSAAVLRSEGNRDEGRGKRQEEEVGEFGYCSYAVLQC